MPPKNPIGFGRKKKETGNLVLSCPKIYLVLGSNYSSKGIQWLKIKKKNVCKTSLPKIILCDYFKINPNCKQYFLFVIFFPKY